MLVHNPYQPLRTTLPVAAAAAPGSPRQPSWSQRCLERMFAASLLEKEEGHDDAMEDHEAELVWLVVGFFAGYAGSIPAERVQNLLKRRHPVVWNAVIDEQYHRRWHDFCGAHPEVLALEVVPSRNGELTWRLRLAGSHAWRQVDEENERERERASREVLQVMGDELHGAGATMRRVVNSLEGRLPRDHPLRPHGGTRHVRGRSQALPRGVEGTTPPTTTTTRCEGCRA